MSLINLQFDNPQALFYHCSVKTFYAFWTQVRWSCFTVNIIPRVKWPLSFIWPLVRLKQGVTSWLWVGIKIWWTRVEVWLKNIQVSVANEFVFCQNLNESPSNLNLHELPWSNTFLPREIQYFPNHSTTHHLLLCMCARIDRVSRIWCMHHAMCAWSTLSKRRRVNVLAAFYRLHNSKQE